MKKIFIILYLGLGIFSCTLRPEVQKDNSTGYAEYFSLPDSVTAVTISPFTGQADTIHIDKKMSRLICMSSSHVAFLDALGMDSTIVAVSGLRYVSSPQLRSRSDVYDIGYEPELDYERILSLKADAIFVYSVSALEPQYLSKLRSLGQNVILLSEHLESHPLARAEYLKLFGTLTGKRAKADSLFSEVEAKYLSLCAKADTAERKKVLLNIPYNDQWFVPGGDNYLSRLVYDAGGIVLGATTGQQNSGTMTVEKAYILAKEAQIWLNPGSVRSRAQLEAVNPLFENFGIKKIYNNNLRMTPEGGNDFWESGNVRPDLILSDLISIFSEQEPVSLNYYIEVN